MTPENTRPHFDIDPKLLSFISHHVRGQYNGLLGFSELLNQNYFRLSDEERLEYILQVNFLAKKAFVNMENMILWLKLISGNLKQNLSPTRLSDILDHCIDVNTDEAESIGVDISKAYDETLSLKTDRIMCSSIVTNLISNAVKNSAAGDEVIVSCKVNKSGLSILVSDEAPDIKNNYISGYFTTVPEHRTAPYEVISGLGLWISDELAKMLGGSLTLELSKTEGKTFTLQLPLEH